MNVLSKPAVKTEQLTKNTVYIIILCLVTIGVINYDVFVSEELWLDDSIVLSFFLLMYAAVHVITILNQNNIIRITVKLLMLFVTGLSFLFFVILLWGYAFTGKTIPVIYYTAVVCNSLLFITVFKPLAFGIIERYSNK